MDLLRAGMIGRMFGERVPLSLVPEGYVVVPGTQVAQQVHQWYCDRAEHLERSVRAAMAAADAADKRERVRRRSR
jgi:hypothetical protein